MLDILLKSWVLNIAEAGTLDLLGKLLSRIGFELLSGISSSSSLFANVHLYLFLGIQNEQD